MSHSETAQLSSSKLSKIDEQWLDDHLKEVRQRIVDEAKAIAEESNHERPQGLDIAEAARRFAPGQKFPEEPSFSDRIKGSLSGITLVSAVLTLIFGILGVLLQYQQQNQQAQEYFDIVKIFAGAIVGSTGAGWAIGSRRK